MSTEDAPKPVAEIHGGLLRWHIPAPDFSVAQKYMCGVHLLFDQATIDAAVAKERERLRALVEVVRDANCDAEDVNTFRLLKPGQERAWLALMAGLNG